LATDRTRFVYSVCASCRQILDETRRSVGLQVRRGIKEVAGLYADAASLIQRGDVSPELKSYVELMDHFITDTMSWDEPFTKNWAQLSEVGILEERVSRIIVARCPPRTLTTLERVESAKSVKLLCCKVDKAQKKREGRARKLYEMSESGKTGDKGAGPSVFDVLFDPY